MRSEVMPPRGDSMRTLSAGGAGSAWTDDTSAAAATAAANGRRARRRVSASFSAPATPSRRISKASPTLWPATVGKYMSSAEAGSAVNAPTWTARTRWRKTWVPAASRVTKKTARSSRVSAWAVGVASFTGVA